jgi:cilia- and flagella-associated protein 57
MDSELERYHKSNAAMDVLIGDLRSKLDGMQSVASNVRSLVHQANAAVRVFKADLEATVQHVQDPEKLKEAVALLLDKHGASGPKAHDKDLEANVVAEYEKQRNFLEKTLATLTNKFANDVGAARAANAEVMRNNMGLIRDITAAREANKTTKATIQSRIITLRRMRMAQKQQNKQQLQVSGGGGGGGGSLGSSAGTTSIGGSIQWTHDIARSTQEAVAIEMAANRDRIAQMRNVVASLEKKLELAKGPASRSNSRPGTGEKYLPPVVPIMPAPIPIPTMKLSAGFNLEAPSTTSLDAPVML